MGVKRYNHGVCQPLERRAYATMTESPTGAWTLYAERLTPEEAELIRAAREQRRTHAAYDAVRGRRTREAVALRRAAGNATLRLFNAASAIPDEEAP